MKNGIKTTWCCAVGAAALLVGAAGAAGQGCEPEWDRAIGNPGLNAGYASRFIVWNDGTGEALYVGGSFTEADGVVVNRVARWDGSGFSALGDGMINNWVNDFAVFDDGTGEALYVGGYWDEAGGVEGTRNLARWDGAQWESVGAQHTSFMESVWALEVFDGALYVGGNFLEIGGISAPFIARWDGRTWTDLDGGVSGGVSTIVLDMKTWDDGTGEALYVAGRFAQVGQSEFSALVAKWDGTQWHSLDGGLVGTQVLTLEVFDDGTGEALYAAGGALGFPGEVSSRVYKWDGTTWSAVGEELVGTGAVVQDLEVFDDGTGPALYAVGSFTGPSGEIQKFARWTGTEWVQVGGGLNANAFGMGVWDDGSGPALYVGGSFTEAGGEPANRVAAWRGCAEGGCAPDWNNDGVLSSEDFFAFLNDFFAGSADYDGSGVTTSEDFFAFLNDFFAGC